MSTSPNEPVPLKNDLIKGVKKISAFLGFDERETYYLASRNRLPGVYKEGNQYLGLKSVMRAEMKARARGKA